MKVILSILTIHGLVQGVGFRPFVYRIACEMNLTGEVRNQNNGVCIHLVATPNQRERFIYRIQTEHPAVAVIYRITISEVEIKENPYTYFQIIPSRSESDEVTQVAPDIAVCSNCLHDRETQSHRLQYPFINCTHCGPRFSIIRQLPYDRGQTTMSAFSMCPTCFEEYSVNNNRRFHAEPIACNHCGPFYYTQYDGKMITDYSKILDLSICMIQEGEVIAVKGIGGYHLICDATQENAVARLREIKQRDGKPFAVMFRDLEQVRIFTSLNKIEEEYLSSWRRPIVLLKQQKQLSSAVNPNMQTLGCMLPYMPIHYDWFRQLTIPAIVMTSGNLHDCPIINSVQEANRQLSGKVSLLIHHNRDIENRVDDSVLQVCNAQPCLIRRSRGYVPEPLFADTSVEGILAFGAEKANVFALGKGKQIIQSQYIGDLKSWETFQFYKEALERFQSLFRFHPSYLVCDLHPDYLSTREAERIAQRLRLPLLRVQHHHAHAVSCMQEYGLREPVIAVVLDGTGLGEDGNVWGGEIFYCDRKQYQRLAHLEYVPLPGGDQAAKEPWRMAIAYLQYYFGTDIPFLSDFERRIGTSKVQFVLKMIKQKIQTPYTSSAGRLFDAVASFLNICDFNRFQAEAAIRLEQVATDEPLYSYPVITSTGTIISLRSLWEGVVRDKKVGVSTAEVSTRFHATLVQLLFEKVQLLRKETGINKVVVSGGCFQNKRLVERFQHLFQEAKVPFYFPRSIPCNDSGIAAGQLVIGSAFVSKFMPRNFETDRHKNLEASKLSF